MINNLKTNTTERDNKRILNDLEEVLVMYKTWGCEEDG